MSIFMTGDTHGDFSRLRPAAFREQGGHKVGGALCTLRRSGGMETYQQLLGTMDAMEMVIVTSDYWGAVHGADPGEALKDEEGMEVAARLGRDMAWMVKVLAESRVPVPESTPRPMMNFIR